MGRLVLHWVCVCALGVVPLVGCSETTGDGGSGGAAGNGGSGGTGGAPECQGNEDCDDGNECTDDVCNPATGTCDYPAVGDGTTCSSGACLDDACTALTTVSGTVTVVEGLGEDPPLAGATVSVLGTSLGTTTDELGRFSFGVFSGDWFFQVSKDGTWGHIELDKVRLDSPSDLDFSVFSDAVVAGLAGILNIDIDETKGWVSLNLGTPSGSGGETATLSEPFEDSFTDDADGDFVPSDELLPGGGQDLGFLNVDLTSELTVTPMGVDGVNTCTLTIPGVVYPVKAKFRTKAQSFCTPVL